MWFLLALINWLTADTTRPQDDKQGAFFNHFWGEVTVIMDRLSFSGTVHIFKTRVTTQSCIQMKWEYVLSSPPIQRFNVCICDQWIPGSHFKAWEPGQTMPRAIRDGPLYLRIEGGFGLTPT